MPELLLHYIWMHRKFAAFPQFTTMGKELEIINVGKYNTDSGPDFFAATIRIGDTMWTGNVEMHIFASDWYRHKHHQDPAYDSVILHVVCHADKQVYNTKGEAIEQCELRFPDSEMQLGEFLSSREQLCHTAISDNPALMSDNWKHTLLLQRLQDKADDISELLRLTRQSWEDAFYITLAHNFGFHTNGLPFEMLAKHTPLAYLRKHRESLFQLTAILLGQAGLIDPQDEELRREYAFLKTKFSLTPIDASTWKYLRMRPQNFPDVRVRQFAQLIHRVDNLFSSLVMLTDLKQLRRLLRGDEGELRLGQSSADLIIINSVIPYMYAYGKERGDDRLVDRALRLLSELPAETNHIISEWKALGLSIASAAESQAYIQLTTRYCKDSRCMYCDVGLSIFTKNADTLYLV